VARAKSRRLLPDGRNRGTGRFVQLEHYLLDSPAWNSLRPTARALYLVLKRAYNGYNNGRVGLSRDAAMAALNVGSPHTVAKAMAELVERGFVRVTTPGGFQFKAGAREGRATEYELTEHAVDGREPGKDFMRWVRVAAPEGKTGVQSAPPPGAQTAPVRVHGTGSPGAERAPTDGQNGDRAGAVSAHDPNAIDHPPARAPRAPAVGCAAG
jgi:hypothetical protein